jgi:hypothetical protein
MQTIWKFPLQIGGVWEVELPYSAEILSLAMQGDDLCFWARLEPHKARVRRRFTVVGTGHLVPSNCTFIGTVHLDNGCVFHAFEL